ncbi:hypothetical protein KW882_00505 [Vibrio parahaemolyticus]
MDIQEVIRRTEELEELYRYGLIKYLKEDTLEFKTALDVWSSLCDGVGVELVYHPITMTIVRYSYRGNIQASLIEEAVCETLIDIGLAELVDLEDDYRGVDITYKNLRKYVSIKKGIFLYSPNHMTNKSLYVRDYIGILESNFDNEQIREITEVAKNMAATMQLKVKLASSKVDGEN